MSMNDVLHTPDNIHVYTELKLAGGQYIIIKDRFEGMDSGEVTVEYDSDRTHSVYEETWHYTAQTRANVQAQIEARIQTMGGAVTRIHRGPWLTHITGPIGRLTRTRIPITQGPLPNNVIPVPLPPAPDVYHIPQLAPNVLASLQAAYAQADAPAPLPVPVQPLRLNNIPYGTARLANTVDFIDPVSLDPVPTNQALYLLPNLNNGRIKRVYSLNGSINPILAEPLARRRSPMTREPFTRADVRRVTIEPPINVLNMQDVPLAKRIRRR